MTILGARSRIAVTILLSALAALPAWYVASRQNFINPLILPPPMAVAAEFSPSGSLRLASQSLHTVARAAMGLLLAAMIGLPAGLWLGIRPGIYRIARLPIDFFRSVPSSSLFFLFILLFGLGETSKVAVVVYGCSLILLVSAADGARMTSESSVRHEVLRTLGATPRQLFWYVILPDALPHIASGMRICVSISLVLVVVTEMFLGASTGLGVELYEAYLRFHMPRMYAALLTLGGVGWAWNAAFTQLESRILFWRGQSS